MHMHMPRHNSTRNTCMHVPCMHCAAATDSNQQGTQMIFGGTVFVYYPEAARDGSLQLQVDVPTVRFRDGKDHECLKDEGMESLLTMKELAIMRGETR